MMVLASCAKAPTSAEAPKPSPIETSTPEIVAEAPPAEPSRSYVYYYSTEHFADLAEVGNGTFVSELAVEEMVYEGDVLHYEYGYMVPQISNEAVEAGLMSEVAMEKINGHFLLIHEEDKATIVRYAADEREFLAAIKSEWSAEDYEDFVNSGAFGCYSFRGFVLSLASVREERLVNSIIMFNNYGGGAHGYYGFGCMVFSAETGEHVTLGDLFVVDEETYIRRVCAEVRKALQGDEQLMWNFYFSVDDASDEDAQNELAYENYKDDIGAFALDAEGITIMFNPYDIGSFADGAIWVKIPYECLADILEHDFSAPTT